MAQRCYGARMLWVALVLGVAVLIALLRGGSLSRFAQIDLRLWWLLIVGAVVQGIANLLPADKEWSQEVAVTLILISFGFLMIVVLANHREVGMWIAGLGILMNFIVIGANAGMPVLPQAAVIAGADSTDLALDAKHVVLDSDSRLVFLADVIPVPFLRQVLSMGDVLLAVGLGLFLEDHLRRPLRLFRHAGSSKPGSAAPG